MVDWFVSSATGVNSNNGTAYTTPKKYLWESDGTLALFLGATKPLAGDTVYVLTGHNELQTAEYALVGGALENEQPIKIISVASFNSGSPNTLGAPASCFVGLTTYVAQKLTLKAGFYMYGLHIRAAETLGVIGTGQLVMEECKLQGNRSGTTRAIAIGGGQGCESTFINCRFENASALNTGLFMEHGVANIIGGGFDSTMAYLVKTMSNGSQLYVDGMDLSNVDGLAVDGTGSVDEAMVIHAKNCLVKSGFTYPTILSPVHSVLATNNKTTTGSNSEFSSQGAGILQSETANVRTGGAKVDGVGYAYEMLPNTDVAIHNPLRCLTITGQADFSISKTIDIYIANTTRDLNDLEINFDLSYPTYNQGGNTIANCKGANWLVAPTNHADDTGSTWGGSPTYMQKMSVTAGGATDGREGPYQIVVWLSVDVDVFVDPLPVIT